MGPVLSRFILPGETLKQPRFYTTSIGWEQAVGSKDRFAANVTIRSGRFGLAYNKESGDVAENIFALRNNRKDCYRALLLSFRHSFSDKTEVSAHYTRSRTRTNQVYDYSLDTLVFNPQEAGPLGWDAPHRFVSSGWTPAPVWKLFLSYYFEYRTGFPLSVVNEQQQVVGSANRLRYPDYASLNLGIEKRLRCSGGVGGADFRPEFDQPSQSGQRNQQYRFAPLHEVCRRPKTLLQSPHSPGGIKHLLPTTDCPLKEAAGADVAVQRLDLLSDIPREVPLYVHDEISHAVPRVIGLRFNVHTHAGDKSIDPAQDAWNIRVNI
jgi:hypothetical protein